MKKSIKTFVVLFAVIVAVTAFVGYRFYGYIYSDNMFVEDPRGTFLYIPTGSSFADVCVLLQKAGMQDTVTFRKVAAQMNYPARVRAGRYRLTSGMNNINIVRMLRSGRQVPVKVTFNNIRTAAHLAGEASPNIEADSASIAALLADSAFLANTYKYTPQTMLAVFIPNTYEFYWNTGAKEFVERMFKEHEKFWNDQRIKKANDAKLTPLEVSVLASIIEEETQKNDEKARMAGVYINRLNKGIPLGADPTLKFAAGDFTIRRVLDRHKKIDSPFNTYLHAGLPPAPICIPSIASIDAVLDYEKHDYLFFCAKDDFSGYHNFARTNAQHNKNSAAYQRALNNLRIFK